VIIYEYERGVKFVRGKMAGILEPGIHWFNRTTSKIIKVSMMDQLLHVRGQEILTKDNISIKISLSGRYKVIEPALATTRVENLFNTIHMVVQLSLREIITRTQVEELLTVRDEIGAYVLENTKEELAELGVELVNINVRDIMFPGALKQIFTEEIRAKKEGLAALERARGETAALRNLANAAKMMKDNPGLLQLRIIQALNESSGNTLVINLTDDNSPILLPGSEKKKP
jgi:regulator of protease activity HflC (stomatin/prohibitin superfamily)